MTAEHVDGGSGAEIDLEWAYDGEIATLMTEVIAVCKRREIPMFASFQLTNGDDPLFCSTVVPTQTLEAIINENLLHGERYIASLDAARETDG